MLKNVYKSEFTKQVATLLTGSALAQTLPFIAEPFIARLYTASELGIITLYISVAMMFSIVATGRYEYAIMLPKSKRSSINLFSLSLFVTILVSFLSFIVVWSLNDWICDIKGNDELGRFLWYVPLSVLFAGVFNSFNQWANRNAYYRWMSVSKVTQSGTMAGLNVLFGYMRMGSAGLIIAFISGQFLSVFPLIFPFLKKDKKLIKEVNKTDMKVLALEYKKFPTINSLHAFTDMFFLSLLVFLISYYFGDSVTGYYGRTYRLLLAPSILIGGVIGQVSFRKMSRMKANGENMQGFFKKILALLFIIGIPIFVTIMFFGDEIFEVYLGKNFRVAGNYAMVLAPWIWLKFIVSPLSMIPVVFNRLNTSFFLGAITNILLVSAIIIGGSLSWSVLETFKLLTLLQIVILSIYIIWTYWLVKEK